MYSIQIELAIGLALAAMAIGGLVALGVSRRVYGTRVRDLKSRLARSETARRHATDLLDKAQMRLAIVQQRAGRPRADRGAVTSTAWIEAPEVRSVDTHAPMAAAHMAPPRR